jgi:hypothetical protein
MEEEVMNRKIIKNSKMKLLLIIFGMVVFIAIPYQATAQEVMYCTDTAGNGFHPENGLYKRSKITNTQFKIQVKISSESIELVESDGYRMHFSCKTPYKGASPDLISCHSGFNMFNFNLKSGRFVFARAFGYVGTDKDSVWLSYGKCDAF